MCTWHIYVSGGDLHVVMLILFPPYHLWLH